MSHHHAIVEWRKDDSVFTDNRYSRVHRWQFDGGAEVAASSSPQVVRPPFSDAAAVDPEEAFVAALSSCHMLWFLSLAAAAGYVVEHYRDAAEGVMAHNAAGQEAMTEVILHPDVRFGAGKPADAAAVEALHHQAHARCYLANSVKSDIRVLGSWSNAS